MIVISSHSFKGGAGRTSSTANLATALASKGQNVCLIDMDLEGAGLSVVLGLEEYLENINGCYIQDYFQAMFADQFNQKNMIINVNEVKSSENSEWMRLLKGNLYFIPARSEFNEKSNINYDDNKPAAYLSYLLKTIEKDKDLNVDYIILDSASGYCDAAMTSLAAIFDYGPHLLLLFTRWSNQHVAGTIKMARHFNEVNKRDGTEAVEINYDVIANVIPFSLFAELGDGTFESIKEHVENRVKRSILSFIPENDDMKWNERIIIFDDDNPRNSEVIAAYDMMADKIISKY